MRVLARRPLDRHGVILPLGASMFILAAAQMPQVTPAVALNQFVNEIADASNNVGWSNSLDLDSQGNPHVGYYDATTRDLKYARKTGGAWTSETADESASDVGSWISLALDSQGNPHMGYYDATTRGVKYARKAGGVWMSETVDGSAYDEGRSPSLALDAEGSPHVTYRAAGYLKYAWKSDGVWASETADGSLSLVVAPSLALDSQGNPHVSYYYYSSGDLKYARKSGGIWTRETVEGSVFRWSANTSLFLDAQGNPHVSYSEERVSFLLRYARKSAGVWTIETAAQLGDQGEGFTSSLALDAQGTPHVSYYDNRTSDLKYAGKLGGVWTSAIVDGPANDPGFNNSLALDSHGSPHISYYDAATGDLTYARARWVAVREEDGKTTLTGPPWSSESGMLELFAAPNPSRDRASVRWHITGGELSDLAVFDVSGRRIRTLASGSASGVRRSIAWDGRDDAGRQVAAGTYVIRLTSGAGHVASERVTLVR